MKKRLALIIAAILIMFTLTGCDSEIAYYFVPGEKESQLILQISVSQNEKTVLENSAVRCTVNPNDFKGSPDLPVNWTLNAYLDILINRLPYFNSIFTGITESYADNNYIYEFSAVRENAPPSDEKDKEEDDNQNIEKSFFYYKVTVEYENPFNEYIKEYNDKNNQNTPVSVFKNGLTVAGEKIFPSFTEAFPYAKNSVLGDNTLLDDDVSLKFYYISNNRLENEEGYEKDILGNRYYLFSTTLDNEKGTVKFVYYRANSVGWNIVTILTGLAVVGGLLLFIHLKSKKSDETTNIKQR